MSPDTWLRNYLHARRVEAICSTFPLNLPIQDIKQHLRSGVQARTKAIGAKTLRRMATLLASSDMRSRDREDDKHELGETTPVNAKWLRAELDGDEGLGSRLDTIDQFVQQCAELQDAPWRMPSARLFLCTRPPSYFDIARRWLYRIEQQGFTPDVFLRLLRLVNAVRGTDYQDPVGQVIDPHTVSIDSFWCDDPQAKPPTPDNPRIVLGNLVIGEDAWTAAASRIPGSPFGAPLLTVKRLTGLTRLLDKTGRVAQGRSSTLLVLPELSLPRPWFREVSNHVVKAGRFGLIAGLEYLHDPRQAMVSNQVFAVLPGPFSSVATWPWTKRLPADEESRRLAELRHPVSFHPLLRPSPPRTVVRSPWGALSVLICSELLEARRIADLLGRVDVVLCPAWNTDTASYDHLIQSVGFQLHVVLAIANNGHYSDCRAWTPRQERWQRDLCRLIERDVDDIVHVDIPLDSLVSFHASGEPRDAWKPLPPGWLPRTSTE